MFRVRIQASFLAAAMIFGIGGVARGGVMITEWMYNGLATTPSSGFGEYVEFTNTGPDPVDMTGWSFDDNSRVAGSQSLTAFGTLAVGESAIFTEDTEANFRSNWNTGALLKIIGGNTNNLGRSDEVNLYDASNALADRLTYNDQAAPTPMGPRTNGASGNTTPSNYGTNNASAWVLATNGDSFSSHASLLNELGNPGTAAIPEPTGASLLLIAASGMALRRRRNV